MWAGACTGLQTVAVPAKLDDCRALLTLRGAPQNERAQLTGPPLNSPLWGSGIIGGFPSFASLF